MTAVAVDLSAVCYIDTSALMKRYIEEDGSDAFDAFCELPAVDRVLCPLGITEFTGALERRVRLRSLTRSQASAVRQRFFGDVVAGGWRVLDFEAEMFSRAGSLMIELGAPLGTLDALHLACALHHGTEEFATADRQLATAAHKAKLHVRLF